MPLRDASDESEHNAGPRLNDNTSGRNRHQASQRAVDDGIKVVRMATGARVQTRANNAGSTTKGGDHGAPRRGVNDFYDSQVRQCAKAKRVERVPCKVSQKHTEREGCAVPSTPQQQAAETGQAVAVRLEAAVHWLSVRVEAAETRAEQDGARERDGAADSVHVSAAAEVHEADVGRASEGAGEPTVEHPVIEHGVHRVGTNM